jgi:protease I
MSLKNKKVAVLLANLYEDLEFWYPYIRMQEAGADVTSIAPANETYKGKHGIPAKPDQSINDVNAEDFDAVIIPGGYSPDHMRRSPEMIDFVKKVHDNKKFVAAICHGGWMLASAEILNGKQVTSFFSIKDDLVHAGAEWMDKEVVVDEYLVTSRTPKDLPAFCKTLIELLS